MKITYACPIIFCDATNHHTPQKVSLSLYWKQYWIHKCNAFNLLYISTKITKIRRETGNKEGRPSNDFITE